MPGSHQPAERHVVADTLRTSECTGTFVIHRDLRRALYTLAAAAARSRFAAVQGEAGGGGHSLLAFRLLDECVATLHAKPDVTELITGTVRDVALSMRTALVGAEPADSEPQGDTRS